MQDLSPGVRVHPKTGWENHMEVLGFGVRSLGCVRVRAEGLL